MTHYPEAVQPLETRIPEELFSYRADLELAQTHDEARAAAAKARAEVSMYEPGYCELMAYAVQRLRETEGQQ